MQPSINSEIARILIEERVAAATLVRQPIRPSGGRRPPRRYRRLGLRTALRLS